MDERSRNGLGAKLIREKDASAIGGDTRGADGEGAGGPGARTGANGGGAEAGPGASAGLDEGVGIGGRDTRAGVEPDGDDSSSSHLILEAIGVSKTLGSKQVLKDIHLAIRQGECFGIIGPNGSGKSTLVKLLSGADGSYDGKITYRQQALTIYTRKQLARQIAVLQQEALPPIGFSVQEVVEMGRYPYQNWLGEEKEDSEAIIDGILTELDLKPFAERSIDALSGGERQRVALAKTAAQQPELLMLDEPTTYLDIGYQQQMMDYIRLWQRREGLTVLAVLHDLNLAALYCDRIMVLQDGRVIETGTPEQVIRADLLEHVYGIRPVIVRHPENGVPQILLRGGSIG